MKLLILNQSISAESSEGGYLWKAIEANGQFYLPVKAREDLERLQVEYDEVEVIEGSFSLGYEIFPKWSLLRQLRYKGRVPRNANTAVDVYFEVVQSGSSRVLGIRFSDWKFWRTLSDQQCEYKLRCFIAENDYSLHVAAAHSQV